MARKESVKLAEPKAMQAAVTLEDTPIISATELDQITNEMSSVVADHPLQQEAFVQGQVVTSPVLQIDPASMQSAMAAATTNQAALGGAKGVGSDFGDSKINAAYASSIKDLESAAGHNQKVHSAPTNVNVQGSTVVMPSEVRDIPNGLYWYIDNHKQYHYVRQKADKLLFGMFGEDLGSSILRVAAASGFYKDPLVWVSQRLWTHINMDIDHKFDEIEAPAFDTAVDENSNSRLLGILRLCFNGFEVRGLSKLARYHDKNVLAILRKIFIDEMADHKMSVPPLNTTPIVTGPTND